MNLPDIDNLKRLIRHTAQNEILSRFTKVSYDLKADGSLITQADLAANQCIRESLAQTYPEIGFLSEEMSLAEQEACLQSESSLWILDPLDGTSNFAAGLPLFATSLALVVNGRVEIGISYDVVRDEMFSAVRGKGAFLNDKPLSCYTHCNILAESLALIEFKRLEPHLRQHLMNHAPYRSHRTLGTSVLEWAWMSASRAHVYLHGGMKIWDLAAGSLILSEAGGYATTIEGEEVFKPTMTPRSVVMSPNKALFDQWCEYVGHASVYER